MSVVVDRFSSHFEVACRLDISYFIVVSNKNETWLGHTQKIANNDDVPVKYRIPDSISLPSVRGYVPGFGVQYSNDVSLALNTNPSASASTDPNNEIDIALSPYRWIRFTTNTNSFHHQNLQQTDHRFETAENASC